MEQRLGVLGGMGPQATQVFYQRILDRTEASRDQEHLWTLILSDAAMPDRTEAILSGRVEAVRDRLVADARLLERAGCTLLAVPCNTSHYFAGEIEAAVSIPRPIVYSVPAGRWAGGGPGAEADRHPGHGGHGPRRGLPAGV